MLALKEIEYLGAARNGPVGPRLQTLIDALLEPLEKEWLGGHRQTAVVERAKLLRTAILPDMISGDITQAERDRRWRQLADIYLAQQLACYPPDYLAAQPSPERILETVERFEEDLTAVGGQHAGQDLEQRRFAGAVVAHQAQDFVAFQRERSVGESGDGAEVARDAARFQHRILFRSICGTLVHVFIDGNSGPPAVSMLVRVA